MRVVLITGASTGLGLALSRQLLKDSDLHLILTARKESLHRFQTEGIQESPRCWLRPLDVTHPDEREKVIAEANAELGGVDVLINNSGIAYRAVVEHVSETELLHQMEVNFLSALDLTRLVLPRMREKRKGHVINISSVSGMMAMPTMSIYSASKFALEGASEALYYELKPWGVFVTLVQPGFIHSDSFEKVPYTAESRKAIESPENPYHAHYRNMENFVRKMMLRSLATPESVARKVSRIMKRKSPPLRIAGTGDARMFYILRRWLPRRFYHWVLYRNLPEIKSWGK